MAVVVVRRGEGAIVGGLVGWMKDELREWWWLWDLGRCCGGLM